MRESGIGGAVRGFFVSRIVSVCFALALGAQLGACASLSNQPRNEVRVRVGPEQERAYRAEPYAALYASYAMISSLAYTTREHGNRNLCPDQSSLDRQHDDYATMWMRSLSEKKWHCVFGLSETQPCPQRYRDCNPL